MLNARPGAKMTARNVEQARWIAATAANGHVDDALAAQGSRHDCSPKLDNEFAVERRRRRRHKTAQQGDLATGPNRQPGLRRLQLGQAVGKLESLREQGQERAVNTVDLAANRIKRIGRRGGGVVHYPQP
jgi:hypothetical protein